MTGRKQYNNEMYIFSTSLNEINDIFTFVFVAGCLHIWADNNSSDTNVWSRVRGSHKPSRFHSDGSSVKDKPSSCHNIYHITVLRCYVRFLDFKRVSSSQNVGNRKSS